MFVESLIDRYPSSRTSGMLAEVNNVISTFHIPHHVKQYLQLSHFLLVLFVEAVPMSTVLYTCYLIDIRYFIVALLCVLLILCKSNVCKVGVFIVLRISLPFILEFRHLLSITLQTMVQLNQILSLQST